jgi:TRAP-type C4-dicarboxylate transport system substrate-binding protein
VAYCLYYYDRKSWDKLPPDVQKMIDGEFHDLAIEGIRDIQSQLTQKAIDQVKADGHTIIYPTEEEVKLWQDALIPFHQQWIANLEAKGLPAKAVYDEAKRLIAEYSK